jgi:hypothetical protein
VGKAVCDVSQPRRDCPGIVGATSVDAYQHFGAAFTRLRDQRRQPLRCVEGANIDAESRLHGVSFAM